MARKPLLDATSRPESPFSSFTKGYRQSRNIEDRRAAQFRPSETPVTHGRQAVRPNQTPPDAYADMDMVFSVDSPTTTPSATRKVDAEEAVRKTHFERN